MSDIPPKFEVKNGPCIFSAQPVGQTFCLTADDGGNLVYVYLIDRESGEATGVIHQLGGRPMNFEAQDAEGDTLKIGPLDPDVVKRTKCVAWFTVATDGNECTMHLTKDQARRVATYLLFEVGA